MPVHTLSARVEGQLAVRRVPVTDRGPGLHLTIDDPVIEEPGLDHL